MLLIDGISGFFIEDSPKFELLNFKRLCYSLANDTKGKLLYLEEPHVAQNFFRAELSLENGSIFILLNGSYPYIAFASSVSYFNIEFIDHSLSSVVDVLYNEFRVLSANELNRRLIIDEKTHNVLNKNSLNKAEIKQILHWKPQTVGEVIFNFWD